MAGDLKVIVKPQMIVEWTAELPHDYDEEESSDFTVGHMDAVLKVSGGVGSRTGRIHLELYVYGDPSTPLHVTTGLYGGTNLFMLQTVTVTDAYEYSDLWTGDMSEVSRFVPDFKEKHTCCFRVVFHLIEQDHLVEKSVQTSSYWDPHSKYDSLSQDLSKMLEDSSSADVELKCGDKTLRAHRSLLSCRSEVFKAMLGSEMLEGKTGKVLIPDIEVEHFEQFLRYLYTGKLPELYVDIALRFYELGDKYSMAGIKGECRDFLSENLALENACVILKLADRHSDQDFRNCATEFILEKKIPLYDEHWSDFCKENPELANEIYDLFVKLHISK